MYQYMRRVPGSLWSFIQKFTFWNTESNYSTCNSFMIPSLSIFHTIEYTYIQLEKKYLYT